MVAPGRRGSARRTRPGRLRRGEGAIGGDRCHGERNPRRRIRISADRIRPRPERRWAVVIPARPGPRREQRPQASNRGPPRLRPPTPRLSQDGWSLSLLFLYPATNCTVCATGSEVSRAFGHPSLMATYARAACVDSSPFPRMRRAAPAAITLARSSTAVAFGAQVTTGPGHSAAGPFPRAHPQSDRAGSSGAARGRE